MFRSTATFSMSVWYLSSTLRVLVAVSAFSYEMPRASRVLAQSIDSPTDGALRNANVRIDATVAAILDTTRFRKERLERRARFKH